MGAGEVRDWPGELRAGGPTTDAALADLRGELLRGLRRALSGRAGADGTLIEDLAQEATLRVLDRLDGYRGESRFTTWAVTVAVRLALTELRRPRWRDVSLDRLAAEDRGGRPDPPTNHDAGAGQGGRTPRDPRPAPGDARRRIDRPSADGAGRRAARDAPGGDRAAAGDRPQCALQARPRRAPAAQGGLVAAGVTDEDVRAAFGL